MNVSDRVASLLVYALLCFIMFYYVLFNMYSHKNSDILLRNMNDIIIIILFYLPVAATYYNVYIGIVVSTVYLHMHYLKLF